MANVRSLVAKANQKLSIRWAAALLSASTFFSLLFGLYRDRLLNSMYLPSDTTGFGGYPVGIDAYTAAFTVPDFMFFILVSGALSVTFIPVFNQRLVAGNKKSAWELSTSLINFMALITLVASILIIIFADPLIRYIVAPGLDESGMGLAISMTRVVAINPFLFAITSVITSMQQAIGRFTFYALAPSVYNIGIIIGILWFTKGINIFGFQVFDGGIMGLALGVVLGSVMQLIISTIGLIGLGFDYRFKIFWKNQGFRKVLTLLPARSLDQGMDYILAVVEINLASRMAAGTVRAYNQASNLYMAPINLIGVAISTAAFPQMSERLSQGRPDLFKKELQAVLRVIIWIAMPVAMLIFATRGYIVSFIKPGGSTIIAGLLGALTIAILFRSIYHLASRSFYAQQDTKTPLYISFVSIGLNIFLAVWFTQKLGTGPYGLAWAQSIVAVIEVLILFVVMSRRIRGLIDKNLIRAVRRMIIASSSMAVVSYVLVKIFPFQATDVSLSLTVPKFIIICSLSSLTYIACSRLLGLREAEPVIQTVKKFIFATGLARKR
ncbi:murein biosynthesis integral membrane protein MurJ [Candidatus Saccharibacteria bacterium]|jgi:putative peptidoglycan lipid II flippase|nr:murein biosynthesis integral membrane protein MurJ [Candidatus Saccharibacteria bacterium]